MLGSRNGASSPQVPTPVNPTGTVKWLRDLSIVCGPAAPIAGVLLEGTAAHLVLAGMSVGFGGAFLWRTRKQPVNGKRVVSMAIGVSLLWLAFVLSIVIGYMRVMRNFD